MDDKATRFKLARRSSNQNWGLGFTTSIADSRQMDRGGWRELPLLLLLNWGSNLDSASTRPNHRLPELYEAYEDRDEDSDTTSNICGGIRGYHIYRHRYRQHRLALRLQHLFWHSKNGNPVFGWTLWRKPGNNIDKRNFRSINLTQQSWIDDLHHLPDTSGSGVIAVSTFNNGTRIETITSGIDIVYEPGSGINLTITQWDNNSRPSSASNLIDFNSGHPGNSILASGKVSSFTFYPEYSTPLTISKDQVFNYVISFQNGQSVSGSLIAQ